MKFSEYLASHITPQMTLLEKFNALLKYLEEYDTLEFTKIYKHIFVLQDNSLFEFYNNESKVSYTFEEINSVEFVKKAICFKNAEKIITGITRSNNINVFEFYQGTHFENVQFRYSSQIKEQRVELL